jgi:small-conductance mechanosensitive channel
VIIIAGPTCTMMEGSVDDSIAPDDDNSGPIHQHPNNKSSVMFNSSNKYESLNGKPDNRGKHTNYRRNFILFAILFSIVHATVDGVLAFAAAELGKSVGSYSGFMLYVTYTLSSLLLANPFLSKYSAKSGVLFGLCGMLIYVCSFFLAILFPVAKMGIFVVGAGLGGVGAGILWPSQGIYFRLVECTAHQNLLYNDNHLAMTVVQRHG